MHDDSRLACRRTILEYGRSPISPWLDEFPTTTALRALQRDLLQRGHCAADGRCMISSEALMDALSISTEQSRILLDLFAAVTDDTSALQLHPETYAPTAVDVHRMALFLTVHLYYYGAERGETADVWPSDHPETNQAEPSSPMCLASRAHATAEGNATAHRWHLPAARQQMQEHIAHLEAEVKGFGPWLAKHITDVIFIVAQRGGAGGRIVAHTSQAHTNLEVEDDDLELSMSDTEDANMVVTGEGAAAGAAAATGTLDVATPVDALRLTAVEVDRLGMLLDVETHSYDDSLGGTLGQGWGTATAAPGCYRAEEDMEEAMEEDMEGSRAAVASSSSSSPAGLNASQRVAVGQGTTPSFSSRVPHSWWDSDRTVSASTLIAWVKESLSPVEDMLLQGDAAMLGLSPPRMSMFNAILPLVLGTLRPHDVHGVHRATVLRGEDDVPKGPSSGISILDCHDAVVYCLAPLQYATVAGCSDCLVVMGAVGRAVRVTRCERVQVVVAARSVVIETCHDCILYLGVNRPPLLLGDNRFVQVAPHNAGYENLRRHMEVVGLTPTPNVWSAVTPLTHFAAGEGSVNHQPSLSQPADASASASASAPAGGDINMNMSEREGDLSNATTIANDSPSTSQSLDALPEASRRSPQPALASSKSPAGAATSSSSSEHGHVSGQPAIAILLHPSKLTPLMVPFRGGPGPLCGGPALQSHRPAGLNAAQSGNSAEDSLAGLLNHNEDPGSSAFAASPFVLPAEYAAAWAERMAGVAAVRSAYRSAGLDVGRKRAFVGAVQAHFREWLQSSGGMREVYDLAKAEKEGMGVGGQGLQSSGTL